MELIFKVETFKVVSGGRVLASGVRPDLKAYIESLEAQNAALVAALEEIRQCNWTVPCADCYAVAEAAIAAAEGGAE